MKKYLLIFSIMMIFIVGSVMALTITITAPDAQSFNYLQSVIPTFEQQNPGITVQVVAAPSGDQISAEVAAGNPPNIFVGPVPMSYVQNGLLLDFTKMPGYDQLASELITGLFPYNGGVYNIPWLVTTQVMFYNKTIFKLAGLNPDDPPQTFSQYLYDAKKISELKPGPYGKYYGQFFWNEELSYSWYWGMLEQIYYNFNNAQYPHLIGQYGLSLDFTNPNAHFVDFLKFCKEAQQYSSSGMQQASIFGRNVGMWLQFAYGWTYNLQTATGGPMIYGKDYGLAPIPTNSDSATAIHWSTLAQRPLIVFKTTPQKDLAAWKFIQFLMEPQNELQACEEIGWLTSVKANANNPFFAKPELKAYIDQLAHVVVTNPFEESSGVIHAVLDAWGQYVVNNSIPTAEQALQIAAKNAQAALNSGL